MVSICRFVEVMLAALAIVNGQVYDSCADVRVTEAAFLHAVADSDHAAHTKAAVLEELRTILHSAVLVRRALELV